MSSIVCACGKPVETKPEWAGQWITCPGCGGTLYSPFPGPKPSEPAVPDAVRADVPTRLCGTCAETIPQDAVACRFCGEGGRTAAAPRPLSRPAASTLADPSNGGMGALIVGV